MTFNPDWVSPTGDTIQDILTERGWTIDDFAIRMGITHDVATGMILGVDPIYPTTAIRLKEVLGGSLYFWLQREMDYRIGLMKKGVKRGRVNYEDY
jgi:HTH-type transcriptional regulator / antitoxin HigA